MKSKARITSKSNQKKSETKKSVSEIFLNSKYLPFGIPVIYFFVYGFIIMTNHPIGNYGVEMDFYRTYVPQAKEILNGNLIIDQYRGPVYQIILSMGGFLFAGDFFSAGKLINVMFASITLFFIFKIIESILSKKAALFTVLLVAANSYFLNYSYESGTDMLFFALYASSIYFILRSKDLDSRDCLIAGILSSLAYLTRYTAVSLISSVLIIFVISYLRLRNIKDVSLVKSFIKPVLSYFTPVFSIIVLWGIYSFKKTGIFFYNFNFYNTASTVFKPTGMHNDEWTLKYQPSFTSFLDVITEDTGAFFNKIFIENFTSYFINDIKILVTGITGALVIAGLILFLIKFRSDKLPQKYFFLLSILFYIQILFTFYSERFSLPLLPFYYFLIVNIFFYDFLQKYNYSFAKIKIFTVIMLTLVIMNFASSFKDVSMKINTVPVGILDISKWMKDNHKQDLSGKTIMGRAPHIAYYLHMNFEVTPFAENYDEFMNNVREKNIEYIYINEAEVIALGKDLFNELLDYKTPPADLEMIVYTLRPTAIIYKVKKP